MVLIMETSIKAALYKIVATRVAILNHRGMSYRKKKQECVFVFTVESLLKTNIIGAMICPSYVEISL